MGLLDIKRATPRASSPQAAPSLPSGEEGGVFANLANATAPAFDDLANAFDNFANPAGETSEARPQASADARAGLPYYKDFHFIHLCHCGKWGSFGTGVSLKDERLGKWFCGEHREGRA